MEVKGNEEHLQKTTDGILSGMGLAAFRAVELLYSMFVVYAACFKVADHWLLWSGLERCLDANSLPTSFRHGHRCLASGSGRCFASPDQ